MRAKVVVVLPLKSWWSRGSQCSGLSPTLWKLTSSGKMCDYFNQHIHPGHFIDLWQQYSSWTHSWCRSYTWIIGFVPLLNHQHNILFGFMTKQQTVDNTWTFDLVLVYIAKSSWRGVLSQPSFPVSVNACILEDAVYTCVPDLMWRIGEGWASHVKASDFCTASYILSINFDCISGPCHDKMRSYYSIDACL